MRRRLLVRFAFAIAIYLVIEGAALAGLQILRKVRGLSYSPSGSTLAMEARANLDAFIAGKARTRTQMDSVLGWAPRAGPEINAAGMRDDRDYASRPAPGVLRISAFGDSFTFGSDVALGENWTKVMSAVQPAIEVLNYGVGAYGLDQAYPRYSMLGADFHPHIVFIGYMTENLARDVNVYRGFYGTSYRNTIFTKPRFRVANGALELVPNPLTTIADYRRLREDEASVLSALGRNDYHYAGLNRAGLLDFSPSIRLGKMAFAQIRAARQIPIFTTDGRYEPRSEAYEVTLRIFDEFYKKVIEDGALPIIVVFPDLNDQRRSREGKPRRYAPLLEYFQSSGYRYIDALVALERVEQRYTVSDLSVRWGHFSKLGNDIVARYMLQTLGGWNFDDPKAAGAAANVERQRLGIRATGLVEKTSPPK